jgi:hypothetical protein
MSQKGGNATFPIYRLMMPVISKAGIRFATTPGITPISAPPLVGRRKAQIALNEKVNG